MLSKLSKETKWISCFILSIFYANCVLSAYIPFTKISYPTYGHTKKDFFLKSKNIYQPTENFKFEKKAGLIDYRDENGPTQPEMQAFQSVNVNNMVDLFSGDFSYNIPLMDVGGYPISLGYKSGISMDQEASWVGLGWNINPGTITRNLRGLPDDFNGQTDTVKKINHIKENKTIGVTVGGGVEIVGFPLGVGANAGIFYNNYKGYGLEYGLNASIAAASTAKGSLTAGLSLSNNSQSGLTLAPSLSIALNQKYADENYGATGSFSASLPYNSRAGLKALQLSAGYHQYGLDEKNQRVSTQVANFAVGSISFALPTFNPKITTPYASYLYSFTGKIGGEWNLLHPNGYISGYVASQAINNEDTALSLPAYGYLNYQNGQRNASALLDFNRDRELPYQEKPATPHIGVPNYTYDLFSMTAEGNGGMFRAYRGDIGYVYDHHMETKDASGAGSLEVGLGSLFHAGVDINVNHSTTKNGAWEQNNLLKDVMNFRSSDADFEAVYFRNPEEKGVNNKSFYTNMGDDDVVTTQLQQRDKNDGDVKATAAFNKYKDKKLVGTVPLSNNTAVKPEREKRSQVISYLTAQEADIAGFSKYIENATLNQFPVDECNRIIPDLRGTVPGLKAEYFYSKNLRGPSEILTDKFINAPNWRDISSNPDVLHLPPELNKDSFSVRWTGYVKAPASGKYKFSISSDDGINVWINDSAVITDWMMHPSATNTCTLNLIAGEYYSIKVEYFQGIGEARTILKWQNLDTGSPEEAIPESAFYYPSQIETYQVSAKVAIEKRVNSFRKPSHISEINTVNPDGKRYIYGIPVYNFIQKDVTFSVNHFNGNFQDQTVTYNHGTDNTSKNALGQDNYYNCEILPSYAHSFLLTSILSPDYVDLTGDGITDDDLGDAIKFNYTKVADKNSPFKWRTPYTKESNKASYNPQLKTDIRDDKGSYVYGEKELWYLNSIQSKNMIAVFFLESRQDLYPIDEAGRKLSQTPAKRLKEIRLYSKADFLKNDVNAVPIKTVHFEYSYDLCKGINEPINTTGKLTLKKVWFSYNGNNKGQQNPYVFNYAPQNPSYDSKSYDRWGNYKSGSKNPGSLTNAEFPYIVQPNYQKYAEDSTVIAENASAWTLTSVTLPSGGNIKVSYESDDYAYVQNKRALQMFTIAGFGYLSDNKYSSSLYNAAGNGSMNDNLIVYVNVNKPALTAADVFTDYIKGLDTIFFKLSVVMPTDKWGSGSEFVPCYAVLDKQGSYYGKKDNYTIWFKIKGINESADGPGSFSPLTKAAIQFLRLNLPSKAYPGSEVADNLSIENAVKMIGALSDNISSSISGFDKAARAKGWAKTIIPDKSMVRLSNPDYKKIGGGIRVKRIELFDNWKNATGQKESVYGHEYIYTMLEQIDGKSRTISSGVASYEPMIGNDENPWHTPIQYVQQAAVLAPVTLGYSEEPLCEAFFPAASVGYRKVRVRSINTDNRKSANGMEETAFYTTYDFPTITDRSLIDENTKKRYKPSLASFLRINAKHFVTISQGFKVELNDMNGKLRYQASYPETDHSNYISKTEYFYKTENSNNSSKKLSNLAWTIDPTGKVDQSAIIGKDVEIMMDMREQNSVSKGMNVSPNVDVFLPGGFLPFPIFIPSLIPMPQSETNIFRSSATTKVIYRHGILDSIVQFEKGSIISTKNILFDSETGNVLLTRTQNEFNDPVYNFSYPSHWAYDEMGGAYKNINAVFRNLTVKDGKIINGIAAGKDTTYFVGGDEILVATKKATATTCNSAFASFPSFEKVWAVDSSLTGGSKKAIFFIDRNGLPFTGNDVTMKILRSGRRNINTTVGNITSLANPLIQSGANYILDINANSKVINASANEYKHSWKVDDTRKLRVDTVQTECPVGYRYLASTGQCVKDTPVVVTDIFEICLLPSKYVTYSSCGSYIYDYSNITGTSYSRSLIDKSDTLWINSSSINLCNEDTIPIHRDSTQIPFAAEYVPENGPLNRTGVWKCADVGQKYVWSGLTIPVDIPRDNYYYIGCAADNRIRITIDNVLFREDQNASELNFRIWHILPVWLSKGTHTFKIESYDEGVAQSFGFEIYNNSKAEIINASSYGDLNIIISTKDLNGKTYPVTYACPEGYSLAENDGTFVCRKQIPYSPIISSTCYSIITDTLQNPYTSGILGNWRPTKSYTYSSDRVENDLTINTNIRTSGTIPGFSPFWKFQNNRLANKADTSVWVWNNQSLLFNKKGFEIENKDPLGRYNAGLYGYNLTLPVAVAQNSRYSSVASEGFEDYSYSGKDCGTSCSKSGKSLDYGEWISQMDSTVSHTGKYSLKINKTNPSDIGLSFDLGVVTEEKESLRFETANYNCNGQNHSILTGIFADSNSLIKSFSPIAGDSIVVSGWVREDQDCNCNTFSNATATVIFTLQSGTTTSETISAAGNIIEGWQRLEKKILIPSAATKMTLSLNGSNQYNCWFDDLRIHPYNSNMKSFVYHPVNLRLMAELDENNYATLYEYDDDGTLVRVKKETEKGIKTIKETRSSLSKRIN